VTRRREGVAPSGARSGTLEERRQARRERLVETAVALFGEHGYHAVTVRDVCAAAKLTERYFYESFPNLKALFIAAYQRAGRPLRQRTLTALASAERTPLGLAHAALDIYVRTMAEDPRATRILLFESTAIGGDVFRMATESIDDYVQLLRGFLVAVAPQGIPGSRIDYIATSLVGASIYAVIQWYREGFATPAEEIVESVFSLYRGLEAVYGTRAGGLSSEAAALPLSLPGGEPETH
jgi:AcrR family transcriptional regulator